MWCESARSSRWASILLLGASQLAACGGRDSLSSAPHHGAGGDSNAVGGRGGSSAVAGRAGGGAAGGSVNVGGASAGTVGGAGSSGTIGFAGTGGVPSGDEACGVEGAQACDGRDPLQRVVCEGGFWSDNGRCATNELCVPASGDCRHVFEECRTRTSGTQFCDGSVLMRCGATPVEWSVVGPCESECVESIAHAYCASARCGDGVLQAGEQCDDANGFESDACVSCEAARCGDGAVWAGHETCDARPMDDAGCSRLCGWATTALELGSYSSCALGVSGRIQCWGDNAFGHLGVESLESLGDAAGEMGARLPVVALGTELVSTALVANFENVCALLDDRSLKCWGFNHFGQLGQGDTLERGDDVGDMGDALRPIDLGANLTAVSAAIGRSHVCAVLNDGSVKCWGGNDYGQLGLGDIAPRGGNPGDMGDNLPRVALGTGVTAKALTAGYLHTCALLSDDSVKCWGANEAGELGTGDTNARGSDPSQLGAALLPVDFGPGLSARAIDAGSSFTCALLSDESVRCWGDNDYGQLGIGNTEVRGDEPGELGSDLLPVDLGSVKPVGLAVGEYHACALLEGGSIKCWGDNAGSQLGLGGDLARGQTPETMGDALPTVDLGSAPPARAVAAGRSHTCTLLDDGTVRCWGWNGSGQLGLGDNARRGYQASTLGDALPAVHLTF